MKGHVVALAVGLAAGIGNASGQVIFERESWDSTPNDTLLSAEPVGFLDGTRTVWVYGTREFDRFGGSSADFYRFDVLTPQRLTVTTDTPNGPRFSGHDTVLGLFDVFGQQIAVDDDSGLGYDSRITYPVEPGTYYAAVSGYSDFSFTGGGSAGFPYALTLSLPVPEPGTYAMLMGGLALIALHAKRRAAR